MNVRQNKFTLTNLDTSISKEVYVADWNNITERLFRSKDYGACNLSQTLPVRFPRRGSETEDLGGYWFIYNTKELRGVKTRIQFQRYILNNQTNDYDLNFTGILDLRPSAGYNKQDEFIECKILDSSKFAKFSSRDEIDYNVFDLVSSDNVTVPDFVNPYIEATYKPIDVYLNCQADGFFYGTKGFTINNTGSNEALYQLYGETIINEIGDRISIDSPPVSGTIYTNNLTQDSKITNSVFPYESNFSIVFTVTGTVTYNYICEFIYRVYDSVGTLIQTYAASPVASGSGNTSQTIGISGSGIRNFVFNPEIDVPEGGRIDFYFRVGVSTFTLFSTTVNVLIDMNNVTSYTRLTEIFGTHFNFYEKTDGEPENQVRGLYAYEALSRLIQLMTSETDTSKLINSTICGRTNSEFQTYVSDGFLGREFITNGWQLRQYVDRALNLNFKDLFKSLNAITPIGCWWNKQQGYFEIEDIGNFYLPELYSFNLGQVKDIKTTDFKDLYFNTIKTGYPKIDYEDYQGVNEVNTETDHEISIEEKSSYDIRSPYFGDSKGQEFARRKNISSFASEDTKYDDNIYLTTLNTSDETIQGNLSSLSGYVGVDQDYNLTKTPRQNLQRHLKIIQAPLYKDITEIITFRKSSKKTNISYVDPERGTTVNEFDNLTQYAIENNIIDPELDEFEGYINDDIANEITENPHKIIPYKDRYGNDKYGYIWEIEFNRHTKEGTFKLIRANENRIP